MKDSDGIRPVRPGVWAVRVARIDARTGRRVNRKATVVGTVTEARAARAALRTETAGEGRRARVTLRAYLDEWLANRAARLKPSTYARYALSARIVGAALGGLYLDAITPRDVRGYVTGRIGTGAAGYTVLNELRLLRTVAKDARADRLCDVDWCDRVAPPALSEWSEENPNLLTGEEVRRLLSAIPPAWRGLVLLLVTTGLRWGEATGLRWGDVVDGFARVARANWKGRVVTPKTRRSRRPVPLLPEVEAALGPRGGPDDLVFPTRRGTLHRGSPLRAVLDRACSSAGVRRVTTHGLRRTFNDMARRVAERDVVRSIMGHTTDAMTSHYSVVDAGERRRAVTAVGRVLGVSPVPGAPDQPPVTTGPADKCAESLQTVAFPLGYGTEAGESDG